MLGKDALALVPSLLALAATEPDRQDAPAHLERALSIAEARLGPAHPDLVSILRHLEAYHQTWGSAERMIAAVERTLAIEHRHFGVDSSRVAITTRDVAKAAWLGGDLTKAEDFAEQALDSIHRIFGERHGEYATAVNLRGLIRMDGGDFTGAQSDLERALQIRLALVPRSTLDIGQSYNNLGDLHRRMLDLTSAKDAFAQAAARWAGELGPTSSEPALPIAKLASVELNMGNREGAERLFSEARRRLELSGGGLDHAYYPLVAMGVAEIRLKERKLARARAQAELALALLERRHGHGHPSLAQAMALLAEIDEAEGHRATARLRHQEVLAMRMESLSDVHPEVAETLAALARVEATDGNSSAALDYGLRAVRTERRHLRLTAQGLPEQRAIRYGRRTIARLDQLLSISASSPTVAPWQEIATEIIRSRAIVLDELALRRRDLVRTDDAELARLDRDRRRIHAQLAGLMLKGPDAQRAVRYSSRIAALQKYKERLEYELARRSSAFRIVRDAADADFMAVQRALPEQSALVGYVHYGISRPQYAAIVVASVGPPRFVPLGDATHIDTLVGAWLGQVSSRPPGDTRRATTAELQIKRTAGDLARRVWQPVLPFVDEAAQVYVVREGSIHLVNFAALTLDGDEYLIERGPAIRYLSAERDLVAAVKVRSTEGELLAVGGPDFDAVPESARLGIVTSAMGSFDSRQPFVYRGETTACGTFRDLSFESLLQAGIEAREVADRWVQGGTAENAIRLLVGSEATEGAFRSQAPNYRVLHVATHGLFFEGCEGPVEGQPTGFEENPLLRSSLVLAAANHRGRVDPERAHDGILTAEEVASLDLSGTEWAVLSACRSGAGVVQKGEGLLGMQRALRIAGVDNLVVSQWDVSDEAARRWARELHARLLDETSSTDPVWEATKRMLRSQRKARGHGHPHVWAVFVSIGR